ncbi:MAG: hypothetical protein AB1757_24335 [Acidobacteriota bacterium]
MKTGITIPVTPLFIPVIRLSQCRKPFPPPRRQRPDLSQADNLLNSSISCAGCLSSMERATLNPLQEGRNRQTGKRAIA